LFADRPELEDKDLSDMTDIQGRYVIREMIEIAKTSGEGFYYYTWSKPDNAGQGFSKIAFIKKFEPFDWFIGTGEYLDDVEKDIQNEVIERLASIRFDKEGYLFASTYAGEPLFTNGKITRGGANLSDLTDPNGVKIFQAQRQAVKTPYGDFVRYAWKKLSHSDPSPKIAFVVGVPDWEWIVGSGVYLDEIESVIAQKRQELYTSLQQHIAKIVLIFGLMLIAAFIAIRQIHAKIRKSFDIFFHFFERAAEKSEKISPEDFSFSEFGKMAIAANMMVEKRLSIEISLKESEAKYRYLFENMSDGVAIYAAVNNGEAFIFSDFNTAGENIENMSKHELIGKNLLDVFPGVGDFGLFEVLQRVYHSGTPEYHPIRLYKDKRISGWRDNYVFKLPSGEVAAIYTDQTDRVRSEETMREQEEQLQQAQKMEAVGMLAGGIAHDFNNILSIILGNAELAMNKPAGYDKIGQHLEEIITACLRARDVVRQLLSFSRRSDREQKPISISLIVKESLRLIRASIPSDIDIRQHLNAESDTVLADPTQIHQVIINLCTNAAHAMQERGGVLEIRLDNTELNAPDSAFYPELSEGSYLGLIVSDTGTGILPEIQDKIFLPYFTTKKAGEGTGLGLSVVHGIVRNHKGAIRVSSTMGKGTSFCILLPVIRNAVENNIPRVQTVPEGQETIMVIDDEVPVAHMLTQMLLSLGYKVESYTDSMLALERFRSSPQDFDLVITDMTMPKMMGDKLAKEMLNICPRTRIIICTGYSSRLSQDIANTIGIRAIAVKPFGRSDLANMIRKVIRS
jgi:signal transduction histidine kinase